MIRRVAAILALALAACSTAAPPAVECQADADCDDQNPCTADVCLGGTCRSTPLPEVRAPDAVQTTADCKVVRCTEGHAVVDDDGTDIPSDAEECTFDTCSEGQPLHIPLPDDEACLNGSGYCVKGKCQMKCAVSDDCDDGNACTYDLCQSQAGRCHHMILDGEAAPEEQQVAGDCRVIWCQNGMSLDAVDDDDVPLSSSGSCLYGSCLGGFGVMHLETAGAWCKLGGGLFGTCDGAGQCLGCSADADCGLSDDCRARTCVSHACVTTLAPAGTPLSPSLQIPGDCRVIVCDGGQPAPMSLADDNDRPLDGDPCTLDLCAAGVPSNPPAPAGTSCGAGITCDAAGVCPCSSDAECTPPATCGGGPVALSCACAPRTCAALGATCGVVGDGCSGQRSCDDGQKNGSETDVDCGGGSTCARLCAQGQRCLGDADCATGHCADGVCCETACAGACMACAANQKAAGLDGICGPVAAGVPDIAPPGACDGVDVCDGHGTCAKNYGKPCSDGAECASGYCVDGVCCGDACDAPCRTCASPSFPGFCWSVSLDDPDPAASVPCVGSDFACDGQGVCRKKEGLSCVEGTSCFGSGCFNGVCCDSYCDGPCQRCDSPELPGTCTPLPAGMVVLGDCDLGNVCDGKGACRLGAGQLCMYPEDCASGICVGFHCQ